MQSSEDLMKTNLSFYNSLKPKNPDGTYTVLAAINDKITGQLLALATGTQANLKVFSDDIEDCHAESLVRRAFKRYLLNTTRNILEQADQQAIKDSTDKIKSSLPTELILCITQFPCGLIQRYEGRDPINEKTGQPISRKPGRGTVRDGKTIYVPKNSCLDKIKKWTLEGFQGHQIGTLLGIRCRISKLIIGDCEPMSEYVSQEESASPESLLDRLKQSLNDEHLEVHYVTGIRSDEFVFDTKRRAQPISLVWWREENQASSYSCEKCNQHQKRPRIFEQNYDYIVDGRKKGATKKQLSSNSMINRLRVGSSLLKEELDAIRDLLDKNEEANT